MGVKLITVWFELWGIPIVELESIRRYSVVCRLVRYFAWNTTV